MAAVAAGAPAVLFREKDLPPPERRALAEQVAHALRPWAAALIIASDSELAAHLGTPWLHLSSRDAVPRQVQGLVGRSCHNAEELRRAAAEGCAYVTLSPLFVTASKPGYGPVLGLQRLAELCGQPDVPPVHALGGVTLGRARSCIQAGASGVAVMGAIMNAADPASTTLELLREVGESRPGTVGSEAEPIIRRPRSAA